MTIELTEGECKVLVARSGESRYGPTVVEGRLVGVVGMMSLCIKSEGISR